MKGERVMNCRIRIEGLRLGVPSEYQSTSKVKMAVLERREPVEALGAERQNYRTVTAQRRKLGATEQVA